jgi:two-component system, cell cycle response regulator
MKKDDIKDDVTMDRDRTDRLDEDHSERTVVTHIKKIDTGEEEKAFILFISGPLMGKMCCLENQETVVGRSEDCDIRINDQRISRRHLKIRLVAGKAIIEDMGSTNGTFVNGERITTHILQNRDLIHISSDTLFNFAFGKEAERMALDSMYRMANYDAVTGINNKHVFDNRLEQEFAYARRNHLPLSLLMIDVDFFKKVNDTYGHMAGDYVLQGVAKRISNTVRDEDILARYGGEEFTVINRGTDMAGAMLLAERIRKTIDAEPFIFEKQSIKVTISIGVSSLLNDNFDTPQELVAHADAGLYKSKEGGRNRVTAEPFVRGE